MSSQPIGIIEGFFGPEWSWDARHHFCESLDSYGGQFYIYAPKRDSFLRKNWTQKHPIEIWDNLKSLSAKCKKKNIALGIGLSPFEIHSNWTQHTKNLLRDKIEDLHELDIGYLGLFFDDMKGVPDLADKQIEIVEFVRGVTDKTILFCPTYYSDDPILDKVFGQRSSDYLNKIGTLPEDIHILWTGNKVIPKTISASDLNEVAQVLKRKPFIWDNYFANDGPKQCKFLKLKPLDGRTHAALESSAGWAFNLMNQPRLSEIVLASSIDVLNGQEPITSLSKIASRIGGTTFGSLLKNNEKVFVEFGLDKIDHDKKQELIQSLDNSPCSIEVKDWLEGKYLVGEECLTD